MTPTNLTPQEKNISTGLHAQFACVVKGRGWFVEKQTLWPACRAAKESGTRAHAGPRQQHTAQHAYRDRHSGAREHKHTHGHTYTHTYIYTRARTVCMYTARMCSVHTHTAKMRGVRMHMPLLTVSPVPPQGSIAGPLRHSASAMARQTSLRAHAYLPAMSLPVS